jgi:prolyl oligopeptidase
MRYPNAPRTDLIDILHGVAVADPFRRLESADDPETIAWVAGQNALTRRLLDSPQRDELVSRLRRLHRVSRMSVAAVRGNRVFFTETDGARAQPILYSAQGSGLCAAAVAPPPLWRATPKLAEAPVERRREGLVDPNLLDAGGTTAITVFEPDDAGGRVVYGLSRHGSDAQQLLIHDVSTGRTLDDRIEWVKFASIAWHGDGFFYTRYPQPGTVAAGDEQYFCQVWHHRVGDPQTADRRVYHRPEARDVVFDVKVTSDGRHLVIGSYQGASDHAEVHVVRLPSSPLGGFGGTRDSDPTDANTKGADARPLVTGFSAGWHFIDGRDGQLYFRTDADAPFGRVVRFDLDEPAPGPRVIVPETQDTIVDAAVANGRLLVSSLRNASSRLASWSLDGGDEREIALPGIGTVNGLGAQWTATEWFATFTSFTIPPTIMTCSGGALAPMRPGTLPYDPSHYLTEQVWYASKDGTPISMFLVSKRTDGRDSDDGRRARLPASTRPDDPRASARLAEAPEARRRQACLLTGYGGFNISLTPAFDPSDILWLDEGGTIAVANLRGGGEYGDAWHKAGMRDQKQNVFDDFIAAAEWLQSSGRASDGSVAIEGGSNGGLLVGACLVQRPDLFGAAICRVPVADMLRYHLFTVGRFWIPEYGSADAENDFPFLLRYSPYHNVVDGAAYPPTLVMTADTDDRVSPSMAKKLAARLQEATTHDGGPILLRVETRAGHGAGKPIEKQIDEQADFHAFLIRYLTRTSASDHTRR